MQRVLGGNGVAIEHRVGVVELGQHAGRLAVRVESHNHRLAERQLLQGIEQVAHHHRRVADTGAANPVVPRRPGALALRQEAGVGMQHSAVGLVAQARQHVCLGRAGVGQ